VGFEMAANLQPASLWVFPLVNAIVNLNTPPHSQIIHTFQMPANNLETPQSLFIRAFNISVQMTTARWQGHGLSVNYANARVQVVMRYPPVPDLVTNFMHFHNCIEVFDEIVEGMESFDIELFRNADFIDVDLLIQNFTVTQMPAAMRRNQVQRNLLDYRGLQGRQNVLQNLSVARGFRPSDGRARIGGYADFKKKMFHDRNIESFFFFTKAVLKVPSTQDLFCFPMAFFKSQMRILMPGNDTSVWESRDNNNPMMVDTPFDPLDCPALREHGVVTEFYYNGCFQPFNPYKAKAKIHHDGFKECYPETPEDYNLTWYLAARDMHHQVMRHFHLETLDHTDEALMGKYYSEFFQCHIHMYNLVGSGNRYQTYVHPDHIALQRHVHILVDGFHCSAITHVRTFLLKTTGSGKMSPHNLCDICTYTTNDSINAATMTKHIRQCQATNPKCVNHDILNYNSAVSENIRRRKLFSRVVLYSCQTCGTDKVKKCPRDCRDSHIPEKYYELVCNLCEMIVDSVHDHLCYIQKPDLKGAIPDDSLWVYDIEAQQNPIQLTTGKQLTVYEHEVIKVILYRMYGEEKFEFSTKEEFCAFIHTSPLLDDATILAHNGGGYDHQYVLTYAELHSLPHTIIPHAASKHKFLSLEILGATAKPRRFIDSCALIPTTLKKGGPDFGLKVAKGDFPHKFSTRANVTYKGGVPPLFSAEDFYGYNSKRSKEDQDELQKWHEEEREKYCTCPGRCALEVGGICQHSQKPVWDFQLELSKYCHMDVEVLKQMCVRYRQEILTPGKEDDEVFGWNYPGMDPFVYLTQSQIAITGFINGHRNWPMVASAQYSNREGYNPKSNNWLRRLDNNKRDKIMYKGNSIKEFYCMETDSFYPGYGSETNTVYLFYDCDYESCELCYPERVGVRCERRHLTPEEMEGQRVRERNILARKHKVVFLWEHEYDGHMLDGSYSETRVMNDRDFFYGGRTEVFSAYARANEEECIKYYDVCSLYPTVCATKELPLGFPEILYGSDIEPERLEWRHCDRYWGFALVKVVPNRRCVLGLLPSRDPETGRLQFTVEEQVGCWHTEQIYLAQENGYVVTEVIQVYHWDKDLRSDTFMRGYVAYYLRMKQEAEGWIKSGASSEEPGEEERERVIEALYQANGCIAKMRAEKVKKAPAKRAIAKLMLNCLWGKFVQKKQDEYSCTVNGYHQYLQICNHPEVNWRKMRFRHVKDNFFKVTVKKKVGYEMSNNKYNIWIGASVTAHAQVYLHRRMLSIGPERVLYCDTDSVIARVQRNALPVTGNGLGKWVDECPDKEIEAVYCWAPKAYNLVYGDGKNSIKTKGVCMTMENQFAINTTMLQKMLGKVFFANKVDNDEDVRLNNMNIKSNSQYAQLPYATLLTMYNTKVMRPVLTKRKLIRCFEDKTFEDIDRIYLFPLGYCKDDEEETLSKSLYLSK